MDSLNSHLGKDKLALEGFSLTFASPDTQDEWNLSQLSASHSIFPFPLIIFLKNNSTQLD